MLILSIISILVLSACSSNVAEEPNKESETTEKEAQTEEVSQENPIFVDEENKLVKVYATVNGKYLVTPTRHGLNWVEGKYGDMAVLNAYADPVEFAEALQKIGGTPAVEKGGDASKEFEERDGRQYIKGDTVKVDITWKDAEKVYDISEVMIDSTGKSLEYHFGGNFDSAAKMVTGCFMCFDSCPVGIISNATHPTGTFEAGEAEFRGNPDVLPGDGTPVVLTYSFGN